MFGLFKFNSKSPPDLELSRVQQCWLILALLSVSVPIWFYLPFWVAGISLFCISWRLYMLWKSKPAPSLKVTAFIGLIAVGLMLSRFWPPIGLEPMGSLLLICCGLKVLEMRRLREARLVLYLCYFVAALQLVFQQAIWFFVIALAGILITLTAQNISERDPWRQYSLSSFSFLPLKMIGKIALISLPLTILIFLCSPRLPSFWSVPSPQNTAKTGLAESMNPGSIADLTRSGELAFRVDFEGEIPAKSELYWRGQVFSDYDGQSWFSRENQVTRNSQYRPPTSQDGGSVFWHQVERNPEDWMSAIQYLGEPVSYDIYQEPSGQRWLFGIAAPKTSANFVGLTKGLRMIRREPVTQRIKYRVTSYPDYRMSNDMLSFVDRQRNLALPQSMNPRTTELAQQWNAQNSSPAILVQRLLSLFNEQHTYTLEPGEYGRNSIDEFIFDRQRGFCEHFAEAAVFFLRSAGIPSRIVGGYQGGETHPDGYLLVHQYDAHAWAEYWLEGRGWVQIDPTAAVSPERIEYGARQFFANEDEFLSNDFLSLNRFGHVAFVNWLRLRLDGVNYLWISWVLGYDNAKQFDFFERLFGQVSLQKTLIYSIGFFLAFIGSIYGAMYWKSPSRTRPVTEKYYEQFRAKLSREGIDVKPGYTPQRLAQISTEVDPKTRSKIELLSRLFERQFYAGRDEQESIRKLLRSWK